MGCIGNPDCQKRKEQRQRKMKNSVVKKAATSTKSNVRRVKTERSGAQSRIRIFK